MARPNVWRTGDLIGHPVTDPSGATLGRVEEVVVDTVAGRIVYAVCSLDGGPRDGHRVYPVPWSALRLHPDRSGFILDATPERLREAVSFRWDESPDLADPALADRLYRFYDPTAVATRRRAVSDYDLTSGRPLPARSSSGTAGLVAALMVMALALGVVFYVLYPRETRVAAQSVGRAAEDAAIAVVDTSEDAATTARVKAALGLSKTVAALAIDVDSDDGVVTLEGEVPDEEAKRIAIAIAEDTSGVTKVVDRLRVGTVPAESSSPGPRASRVADVEAEVRLREALRGSPYLEGQTVEVTVAEGVATLRGEVATREQRERAERIALDSEGVREVVNLIESREPTV